MNDVILVFTKGGDPSSSEVIHWMKRLGCKVVRINSVMDLQDFVRCNPQTMYIDKEVPECFSLRIKGIWYRRHPDYLPSVAITNEISDIEMGKLFRAEQKAFFNAFCSLHQDAKWLNRSDNSRIGKIAQLVVAKSVGLDYPESRIITSKKELAKFFPKKIIIKPIQDVSHVHFDGIPYTQYTTILTQEMLNQISNDLFPCLCQKYIDKNIEIRSFFMNDKIYSMGICSTFDKQTSVDFRRYNRKHPNRVIPYKLPDEIEKKIRLLMRQLKLNCGSLDVILGNDGKYYFLEVNPVGQFGMVSKPCNYYLEREMAKYLTQ